MADNCLSLLKADPGLSIPGFSIGESARTICRAMDYSSTSGSLQDRVSSSRRSMWPTLGKAVEGGLQHVISVDNAAGYAELWAKGGNWYAVTGAALPTDEKVTKSSNGVPLMKTGSPSIYEVPTLYKGMDLEEASARFLKSIFASPTANSSDCKPCGAK